MPANTVEILFSTSDGKKEWVEEITKTFNARHVKLSDGRVAKVKLNHMRSGESIQKILAGDEKPHLWSPVNKGWISRLNEAWQLRHKQDFIASSRPTARTALVLATWEPMARALGWPEKKIGWEEFLAVAHEPKGWGAYGHPEWGAFKFGHAHPDYATSANLSLASLVYAKTGKTAGLTAEDVRREDVRQALLSFEQKIVHYGESSNWLTEKMCTLGPSYLSAVPLYESSVTKANAKWPNKAFPLVAISPKEGTFFEDHPAGVVEAEWCGAIEKEAANLYLDFLGSKEAQERTSVAGFHPADEPLPKDAAVLQSVTDDVFKRLQALWHQVKKKSTVYLVVDTSGSMNGEPMNAARKAAAGFLRRMEPDDEVQVIAFSDAVR
ncbi:MAG: substrate-binding domain-containing protein, partial [Planctomycetota bacterium]